MYKVAFLFLVVVGIALGAPGRDPKVIGGEDAEEGAYPYQASLRSISNSHFCGGIIITKRTILTAAHCLAGRTAASTIVYVGTNKLNTDGVRYQAASLKFHEDYNPFLITNDVGVVIVTIDINFEEKVQPIPMEYNDVGGNVPVTLTGWGTTSFPGSAPNNLQVIQLKTITFEECNSIHKTVIESEICTFTKSGEGACHGDSGGPLVADGKVVGIVSWGSPCARGYPDVFTRVSSFTKWIEINSKK